jgi:hypothetical protein
MEDKIARVISVLFHPLLLPTYFILIIFSLKFYISIIIPLEAKLMILSLVLAVTFIFPAVFMLIIKNKGLIKSLQMETKEERNYPYITAAIFNFSAYYMIRQIQIPEVYYLFFLGSAILILVTMIINLYTKISIHMIGAGGFIGSLIGISLRLNVDLTMVVVLSILISGFIGFARLRLKAHNSFQIYAGFTCGLFVMMIFLLI